MNALWNKKDLERPANNVWIANRRAIDLKRFISALETATKDLNSQNVLHMEAAILSRLIYRMKSKFRNDKGLKNMEKVNRALLNYLDIKLNKEYKDLKNSVEADGIVVNLPTKQMLQYILVRTQGFAKLMARIEHAAKSSAEFFKARISIGHAWTVSVIAYAVVSRIWYLSRYLLKRCCLWYENVFEHVGKFREIGPRWLPDGYNLPDSLKTWLRLPWIDQASDSVPLKDDGKETIFSLIKSQIDDPSCDLDIEISKLEDQSVEEIPQTGNELIHTKPEVECFIDDIGMSVDREAFQMNLKTEIRNPEDQVKSEKKLKRKKKNALSKVKAKKLKILETEKTSVKERKKVLTADTNNEEQTVVDLKINKLKLLKTDGKCKEMKNSNSHNDIKTRDDLSMFLSKDSYPGLDRMQWNMLMKSIKKFVTRLEKCKPSEEKRERILLKKVNSEIKNWIK